MQFLVTGGMGFIGWRVVRTLLQRKIPVVVADWHHDPCIRQRLEGYGTALVEFASCDVSEFRDLASILHRHNGISHAIHLAYLMSAEVESNPHLGSRVNVLGTANLLEIALIERLQRVVFTSSEAVYGASQSVFGERPIVESDYCSPADQYFTYAMMKQLNEFMAEKYAQRHGISVVCTRPPIVFGHGRRHGSLMWSEEFVTLPALGKPVQLPFPAENRDCWLYVDDCAEQLVRLALKPGLSHFVYNHGGHSVAAHEFAAMVKEQIPNAQISFDEHGRTTPLVDRIDGQRLEAEIQFAPRSLRDSIRAHIQDARTQEGFYEAIPQYGCGQLSPARESGRHAKEALGEPGGD
jgi:UDP-glucose 4-epimerase